jgi:hypothetical protein
MMGVRGKAERLWHFCRTPEGRKLVLNRIFQPSGVAMMETHSGSGSQGERELEGAVP